MAYDDDRDYYESLPLGARCVCGELAVNHVNSNYGFGCPMTGCPEFTPEDATR